MTWEWSHTAEAYDNARANLQDLPREQLRCIYAEWQAQYTELDEDSCETHVDFDEARYATALADSELMADDTLADYIWDRASEQATCDNGGFSAWLCPHGCGPHCVPFDREQL